MQAMQVLQDAYMDVGGRQRLEHIVEQKPVIYMDVVYAGFAWSKNLLSTWM